MTSLLDVMRKRVGVKEFPGEANNPVIVEWFKALGHPHEPDSTAWCAVTVGSALKECGYPVPPANVNMMARAYLTYGKACEVKPGAIAIWPRGNSSWQGHVNVVEELNFDGTITCIGGNQSDAVTRTKHRTKDALGFRWPVMPTVPELRKAGSKEIKKGDALQNVGTITVAAGPVIAAVSEIIAPATKIPEFNSLPDSLTFWQQVLSGFTSVGKLVATHPWLASIVFAGICAAIVGKKLNADRVAKAALGMPLSAEVAKVGGSDA